MGKDTASCCAGLSSGRLGCATGRQGSLKQELPREGSHPGELFQVVL